MNYAFKMIAVVLILLISHKLVLAEKLPLDCKTIKKNVENIIKNNNPCGLTKPQSCYSMEVISEQKYNSLEYQIYIEGNLSKSYLQVLEERDNTFSNSLIFHSINNKTQTINYIFEDKSLSSKSMLAENENCNFLDLFKGTTSVPLNASYNEEMDIDNIPKWCLNIRLSKKSLISCGVGESKNKHIAKDIALLNARTQIGDALDSEIISKRNEYFNYNGIMSRISIGKSEILKMETLRSYNHFVNNKYIHYNLTEYPILNLKKLPLNKTADEAMKELEAKINNIKKIK